MRAKLYMVCLFRKSYEQKRTQCISSLTKNKNIVQFTLELQFCVNNFQAKAVSPSKTSQHLFAGEKELDLYCLCDNFPSVVYLRL